MANHMFNEEEHEAGRRWSQAAGEHEALRRATELAFEEAAGFYRRGEDKSAELMRSFARKLDEHRAKAGVRLDAFIKEALDKR